MVYHKQYLYYLVFYVLLYAQQHDRHSNLKYEEVGSDSEDEEEKQDPPLAPASPPLQSADSSPRGSPREERLKRIARVRNELAITDYSSWTAEDFRRNAEDMEQNRIDTLDNTLSVYINYLEFIEKNSHHTGIEYF